MNNIFTKLFLFYFFITKIYKYNIMNIIIKILLILIIIQLLFLLIDGLNGFYKYFMLQNLDLYNYYQSTHNNSNPWVIITGPSSGQGKIFAHEFAKRNFNLLLIGSKRIDIIKNELIKLYPNIQIKLIYKDFRKAYEDNFFDDIENAINNIGENISILINNTGYRTGWNPYHEMDPKLIRDTISAKPLIQSYLCRLVIPIFMKKKRK